jgi:hypothetical protein
MAWMSTTKVMTTALFFNACLHDNCEGALYLIEYGAEINAVTVSKRLTPFAWCFNDGTR